MPTVRELSDPYANFMLNPVSPAADDTCPVCLTFTQGYPTCYPCGHNPRFADAVLPASYSIHLGQLHTALDKYKRGRGAVAAKFQLQLSAVLWRFLSCHESCLAQATHVEAFDVVTTVPSGSADRDADHPLRRMVGELIIPTARRYERILFRSTEDVPERSVNPAKYRADRRLRDESVLLIDDTRTTGANAQSAAGALKEAGASEVGVVVVGRHIHNHYENNAARLQALPRPFEWTRCALE